MGKPIDLRDSLVGHVILWSKGWYHERNTPRTLERLNEVVNSITGMPDEHVFGVRELLGWLGEAAMILQVSPREFAEAVARETAFDNKRLTSYHTQFEDKISMNLLVSVYSGLISCGRINDGEKSLVLLPELNDAVRKKYQLEKFSNREF